MQRQVDRNTLRIHKVLRKDVTSSFYVVTGIAPVNRSEWCQNEDQCHRSNLWSMLWYRSSGGFCWFSRNHLNFYCTHAAYDIWTGSIKQNALLCKKNLRMRHPSRNWDIQHDEYDNNDFIRLNLLRLVFLLTYSVNQFMHDGSLSQTIWNRTQLSNY